MLIGELLTKMESKNPLRKVAPPPQTSVVLMTITAVIAVINLKTVLPDIPTIVLSAPGVLAIIYGAFYPRLFYIGLLIFVSVSRYFYGIALLNEESAELIRTIILSNAFAIFVVEVERRFWKQSIDVERGFQKFSNIVEGLEKSLYSSSRMLDPQIGASELLSLCVDRFLFSGAYLYHLEKKGRIQKLVLYSSYENKQLTKRKIRLLPDVLSNIEVEVSELMTHLFYKSISVCSSVTPNDFLNSLRRDINVKTIVAVGIEYHGEIVGCILMVDTKESMTYESFDDRLILIVRSIAELLYEKSLDKEKRDKLRKSSFALTKLAIEDIYALIEDRVDKS